MGKYNLTILVSALLAILKRTISMKTVNVIKEPLTKTREKTV